MSTSLDENLDAPTKPESNVGIWVVVIVAAVVALVAIIGMVHQRSTDGVKLNDTSACANGGDPYLKYAAKIGDLKAQQALDHELAKCKQLGLATP